MSIFWSRNIKMMFLSEKRNTKKKAFTLVEVVTALTILAIIASSVVVVINRCVTSAADSAMQMHAFEVARENMEKLLASSSLQEGVDYGSSDKYPGISWQTVVETFYEPITARMWIRGVCSARYMDAAGQEQKVELIHWLTDLTKAQLLDIMMREQAEQLAGEIIETIEEAAKYAGVNVETVEQWIENGMLTTDDGSFIKSNLDLFLRNNGNPSEEDKELQVQSVAELMTKQGESGTAGASGEQAWKDQVDPKTGFTYRELEEMDFSEVLEIMKNRQR